MSEPARPRWATIRSAWLRKDVDRHPNCVELEERIANSEGQGAVSMTRLVRRTLRQNPDRVIVGEVLGPEVIDMLNAMGQGNEGSMSTIHARTARDVFNRIATYAIQSQEQLPHTASFQLIAGGLDFVVFISRHPKTGKRQLDSILEVNGFDDTVQASEIFAAGQVGSATWTGTMPSRIDRLAAAGWQPPGGGQGGW
jgi:Flp pilus assembly CpaF family ATPase